MKKYRLGYIELYGKKKSYIWEIIGSILLAIVFILLVFGLLLI